MMNRKSLIIAIVASVFTLLGMFLLAGRQNKDPIEATIEESAVETTESAETAPTNGLNITEDGHVIGDDIKIMKFVTDDMVAFEQPDVKSNVIANLKRGDCVMVTIHSTKGWCEIKYEGITMYVDAKYLSENAVEREDDNVTEDIEDDSEPRYSEDGVYLIVNEEVRTEGDVWLHIAPKTSSQKIVVLSHGHTVTRIGVGSNGWSQILYNDEVLYVATYWVTPTRAPRYDDVQEFVKLTESANLREEASINSRKIVALDKGAELVRIGIGRNGWSKVIYNGRVRYIYSTYIALIDREVTEEDLLLKD